MTAPTYKETVYRYRVVKHEELPEEHKAEYRLNGIDPDDNWTLVWSFKDKQDAIAQLMSCRDEAPWWQTFKMVDAGKDEEIERTSWF